MMDPSNQAFDMNNQGNVPLASPMAMQTPMQMPMAMPVQMAQPIRAYEQLVEDRLIFRGEYNGVQFTMFGSRDFPMIEAVLAPGARVNSEPGRMVQLPEGVDFKVVLGDGTESSMGAALMNAASAMFSGENITLARFENNTNEPQKMRFGTVVAGYVIPLNLAEWGGEIIGMSGVYLMGSDTIKLASCFRQSFGAALFGGESFILQSISGEGQVFLQAGGSVMQETLTPERPTIKVDTGCLVAFTNNVDYSVTPAGGLKSWVFGGEGIFFAHLSLKPGFTHATVWLETFPYSKFLGRIKQNYRW